MGEAPSIRRIVALGASNLTRGFPAVVAGARTAWGRDVAVLAALGHGRSYGAASRVLARTLPGILDCGLWRQLATMPPAPTRALVTDVGNDILYGASARQILEWVAEVVVRLRQHDAEVVLTDLPLASIRRLSPAAFLAVRTVLFPACRLPFGEVIELAEEVSSGLVDLATRQQAKLVRLRPEWYGLDPIHVRPALTTTAWRILGAGAPPAADRVGASSAVSAREWLWLYLLRPEKRWLFGILQQTPQAGLALVAGGKVWLY